MQGSEAVSYEDPSLEESVFRSTSLFPHEALLQQFKNYRPHSDIVNMQSLASSSNLKLKKYRTAAFYGEFVNGKRHGKGIMLYNNGRQYEGQWECNLKHGRGHETFQNGCTFTGFYVNGKPQGLGHFQWPNGQFYEGEWVCGLKHGSGMWSGAKGDNYVGEWKLNKADGVGVHVWINGDRYEGQFRKGLKNGQGIQKFTNGDLYKGTFYMGKPHGYGEYFWSDGSFYKGNFRNGFRDGSGTWKKNTLDSDKYQGEYIKDKKHGYGIYTWSTGNVYKGNYENDIREGYGQMYWNEGSYYKGQWRRGNQEGEGVTWSTDHGLQKGRFSNNALVELYQEEEIPLEEVPIYKKKTRKRSKGKRYESVQLTKIEEKSETVVKNNKKPYILIRDKIKPQSKPKQITHSSLNRLQKPQRSKQFQIKPSLSRPSTRPRIMTNRSQRHQSLQFQQQQTKREKIQHSSVKMTAIDRRVLVGSIQKNLLKGGKINHMNVKNYQRSVELSKNK